MKLINEKLAYLLSGGLLVAVGMALSPVTAQKDKFGEIECTKLTVVDEDGIARVLICTDLLAAVMDDSDSIRLRVLADKLSSSVEVRGEDGESSVLLGIDALGGRVDVGGKDGKSRVVLRTDANGGLVTARGKDGKSKAGLSIGDHGGRVDVTGKGEGMATMGVNDYGNGAMSTWDKNGYRQ